MYMRFLYPMPIDKFVCVCLPCVHLTKNGLFYFAGILQIYFERKRGERERQQNAASSSYK